jgi:hypothetical protein
MMHVVDVDQSGKFENTKHDTVVAFSNGIDFSVIIPATVKRDCITALGRQGISDANRNALVFATLLFFLLRHYIEQLHTVIIDIEYREQEPLIKDHLMNILRRAGYRVRREQITFGHIGKHSRAHEVAIETFRRNRASNLVLTLEDILGQFRQ